jgi:hypothetical protein
MPSVTDPLPPELAERLLVLRRPGREQVLRPGRVVVDEDRGPVLGLESVAAGTFDFVPLLQGALTRTGLSWKISDHYPLWVEFSAR